MKRKLKNQLPKANPGGLLKNLLKPRRLKRFFDIKNNPINQANKSNSIFNNTLAFKESQNLIDQMKGLVNKTDEGSQIEFMNIAGQLQKLNPKASFHFNSGEANQYKHKFQDQFDMRMRDVSVPVVNKKTGQYTNVGDFPKLAKYMNEVYPDMVDVNMTGRAPLNMRKNSAGAPYYSELSENLRQYGDFGMAIQGLQSTDPKSLLDFSISRAPFGKIESNYNGDLGNQHNFLQHNSSPFKIESPLAKSSDFKKGVRTSSGFSGLKMNPALMETDPNFEGTFMKFINKIDIPQSRLDNAVAMKNNKEFYSLINQEAGPKYKLDYNVSDLFKKRPEFYPQYKQEGGPLKQYMPGGPVLKLSRKLINKNKNLNIKNLDKTYSLSNFSKNQKRYYNSILEKYPELIKNNELDISKFDEIVNRNIAPMKVNDIVDQTQDVSWNNKRGTWEGFKDNFDGLGTHGYNNLYPNVEASNTGWGEPQLKNLKLKPQVLHFTMPSLLTSLSGVDKMLGKNTSGYTNSFHTSIMKNAPGTFGWARGFADPNDPTTFLLNELQNDLLSNRAPLTGLLNAYNVKDPIKREKEISRYKKNSDLSQSSNKNQINDLRTELNSYQDAIDNYKEGDVLDKYQLESAVNLTREKIDLAQAQMQIYDLYRGPDNLQLTSILNDTYSRQENELMKYLSSQGYNKIGIPQRETMSKIQNWNKNTNFNLMTPTREQQSTLNYYENLSKKLKKQNNNTTPTTLKVGTFDYDIQPIIDKDFVPFKKYGGQTPWLSLNDSPDPEYKNGGPTYEQELDKFQNFIQQEEAGWDYVKSKKSAILKPDGKNYYKVFENNKFYPYYHENDDGTFESEATIGFGRKGSNIFTDYKNGMSLEDAEKNQTEDINNSLRKTKIFIDANYGDGAYKKLSNNEKFMLSDFTYNLGRLSKFPNYADAIMTGDVDKAILEYIRKDKTDGSPLSRNKSYLKEYLQPWIDETNIKNKEEQERLLNQDNIRDTLLQNSNPIDNTYVAPPIMKKGGAADFIKKEEYSWYQKQLKNANGNKEKIDKINKKYPQYSKMNYNDAFSLARSSAEANFGDMTFNWNGKDYTVEEGDDNILQTRDRDELYKINDIINQTPASGAIANGDISTKEDYYNYLQKYYKDSPNESRLLRDIKKDNPNDYLEAFNLVSNNERYNTIRSLQNEKVGTSTNNSYGSPQSGYMSKDGWIPASENTAAPFINNIKQSKNQSIQSNNLDKKNEEFLVSNYFNKGKEQYNEFSENYDAEAVNTFKREFAKNTLGFKGEQLEGFLNYNPNQINDGTSNILTNPEYDDLYKAMNNQMNIQGVVANSDIGNFDPGKAEWQDKDKRMQLMGSKVSDPSYNMKENRNKTWWEDNIGDAWNTLGNKMGSSNNDALNIIGQDLIHGTADWLGDTGMALAGVRPYEAGQRFIQDPFDGNTKLGINMDTALGPIIDAASFLGPIARTLGQGFKRANFINKGLKNTTGFKNNISRGFNLDRDFDALQKINRQLKPNAKPIDLTGNRPVGQNFGNDKFGFNSPFTGENYIFNKSDRLFK